MKRALLGVSLLAIAAAGFGVGAPSVTKARAQTAGPPVFDQVGVTAQTLGGEPGIWVDKLTNPPTVYVVEPQLGVPVWRSNDDGQTFTAIPVTTNGGGGDSDVVTDADSTVYVSDLLSSGGVLDTTIPVSTSFDRGQSFDHLVELDPPASGVVWDRQWNAAEGHGHVVIAARGGGYVDWVSRDQARTFTGPHMIDASANTGGPIVFSRDGSILYGAYGKLTPASEEEVRFAKSLDGGETWTTGHVATIPTDTPGFIVLDVDDGGNLYVTWSQSAGGPLSPLVTYSQSQPVYVAVSTDTGNTWSTPINLSGNGHSAIFPWVAAGEAGRANVAWYQANDPIIDNGPDLGKPTTTWDIVMAQSIDATSATPHWDKKVVVSGFHTGSICTGGLSCVGPQNAGLLNAPNPYDRRVLDFFEMAIDPNGNALIAYPKDRPQTTGDPFDIIEPFSDLLVARQVDGTRLRTTPVVNYPAVVDVVPCAPALFADAAADEAYTYDLVNSRWRNLDLVAGDMSVSGSALVVKLKLDNLTKEVPVPGVEMDYYMTWLFHGTRYYANATVDRQGNVSYVTGFIDDGIPSRHATATGLTGSFGSGPNGVIQINVPLADIGNPQPGDVLLQPSAETDVYNGSPVHGVTPVSGLLSQVDTAGPGHDYGIAQVCTP
jgi:hypothetical protein